MRKLRNSGNNGQDLLSNLKLRENPFSVPEGYFHNLTKDIIQRKNIVGNTKNALLTPVDFQAKLTTDILMRVSEEKLKATITGDGFTVPKEYFEQLQSAILEKTYQNDPKIISMPKSRPSSWIRYASAACIAVAASIFAFFQLDKEKAEPHTVQVENIIDEIPADEIISYLAFYSETGDYIVLSDELSKESTAIKASFSSEEIESYLENSI